MDAHPDIRDFFENTLWRERFDDECLEIAPRLRSKVREPAAEWPDDDNFILRAGIAGETCEITLWPSGGEWDFESDCTCETRRFCPHAAALLEEASKPKNLSRLLEGKPIRGGCSAPILAAALVPDSADLPHLELTPSFHLQILREPTESKIVRLLLQALKIPDTGDWVVARPFAIYGEHRIPLGGIPGPREHRLDGLVLRRDIAAEMNAILSLQQTGLSSLAGHAQYRFLLRLEEKKPSHPISNFQSPSAAALWFPSHGAPAEFWPWLRAAGAPILEAAGWTVSFDEEVGHEIIDLDLDHFRYTLEDDGAGWFHLSVGFEVGEKQLDLLPILAQLLERGATETTLEFPAAGQFLHHLEDGRALRLPADRIRRILKQFAALIDPRRFKGGKLKLHPLDAATLAHHDPEKFSPPDKLVQLIDSLTKGSNPQSAIRNPQSLRADLRDYQRAGFEWMQFLTTHELHGILADDMGLGKTLQTITHILAEKESGRSQGRPALVIAPTSVVPNWRAEANRFAPSLRVLILDGPQRKKYFRSIPYADLVLTSYALAQRDIEALKSHSFHLAVLDEAQYIKNPASKVAQAVCRLDARHRLCLSGTPVENHLGELWSLMRFLMPGFLGGQEDFNRRFRNPIERDGDEDRRAALKARVASLILRRTKDQVAKELPPKTILVHPVELNTAQKDLYETVRATMDKRVRQSIAIKGLEGSRMLFLEALLKLRQICCEPKLLKFEGESKLEADAAGSAKLDYLADLLDTLIEEGRRILLFSQFTSMLEIVEQLLQVQNTSYLKLTGGSKNRGELVEKFQSGAYPVFLISLKAGGTGLNLTAADTVIHYDPWWNPAAEAQATDRAYRIGQTQPVFVHKLICQGTVEERIHQLQAKKSQLADSLLSDAARAAAPDESTLSALLAPLG